MSRAEREAWQARLDADPVLRAAWNGLIGQLTRYGAAVKSGPTPDLEINVEAVAAVTAAQLAVRQVYAAAGLDPDQADDAPDDA